MIKKLAKVVLILILGIITLSILETKVAATELKSKMVYTKEFIEWNKLSDEEKKNTIMPAPFIIEANAKSILGKRSLLNIARLRAMNNFYQLKDDIQIEIKNQEQTGECWAFSANSVLETTNAVMNNEELNLSERYLDYATSRTFLNDEINQKGFNREVGQGGNMQVALPFYLSGQGPIDEEDMPFENSEQKIALSEIQNKEVVKKIESYELFPTVLKTRSGDTITYTNGLTSYTETQINDIREQIKEHIMTYGGVSAITYASNMSCYTPDFVSYYCDSAITYDHQITIVGWDDNYAITNFREDKRPVHPGAYIILNSYGTEFADEGYYYISYDDKWIEASIFGIKKITDIDYDHIYQYDEYGISQELSSPGQKSIYGANVFSRDVSKNEKLQEVGINSLLYNTCDIYVNANNGTLSPSSLTKVNASPIMIEPGYTTVKLNSPISLTGSKYAIVVKYTGEIEGTMGIEHPKFNMPIIHYATSEEGQSFYSFDMSNWEDLKTVTTFPNANVCIKGFTKEVSEDPEESETEITIKDTYEIDTNTKYIYKILPNTTVEGVLSKIEADSPITIYNSSNQEITGTVKIGTGMKLRVNEEEYTLVTTGDMNGDGDVTATDLSKIRQHIAQINVLVGAYEKAGDITGEGDITGTDLSKIRRHIAQLELIGGAV